MLVNRAAVIWMAWGHRHRSQPQLALALALALALLPVLLVLPAACLH